MPYFKHLLIAAGILYSSFVLGAENVEFDNETYIKKYANMTSNIAIVEYVREDETLKNWSKLIAIRNFTNLENPEQAAINLAKKVNSQNPKANFQILKSNDGKEAQIDFLTWPKSAEYTEFNIHRYMKVKGYTGLISYQFAYRFDINTPSEVQYFKENKNNWVKKLIKAKFEIEFIK